VKYAYIGRNSRQARQQRSHIFKSILLKGLFTGEDFYTALRRNVQGDADIGLFEAELSVCCIIL
jgi:hypothetical protein